MEAKSRSIYYKAARSILLLSWLVVELGSGGLALAQTSPIAANPPSPTVSVPPTSTVQGLTVIARRPHGSSQAQTLDFVRAHGAPTAVLGQFARWTSPMCPVTVGLSAAMNAFVSAKVITLAARVGAPSATVDPCKPNIDIIFTDEPQKIVDRVAGKQSAFLGFHYVSQAKAFTTVSRPIQAWYLTGTRNSSGQQSLDVVRGVTASEDTSLGRAGSVLSALRDLGQRPEGNPDSRLTQKVSSFFSNVLIVADAQALSGREIGPVADYIALLTLSQSSSLDGCDSLPSILDLLAPKCSERTPPETVTDGDVAYLRALYAINLETRLFLEQDQIADRMARQAKTTRGDMAH